MTNSDILQQRDHLQYRNDIDTLFSGTSLALASLLTEMQLRNMAVPRPMFRPFYEGFNALYLQTAKSKHMQEEKDLIDRMEHWLDPRGKIDINRVMDGRKLFQEWGRAMEKCGLHTFTK